MDEILFLQRRLDELEKQFDAACNLADDRLEQCDRYYKSLEAVKEANVDLQRRLDEAVEVIKEIKSIASGEEQVADDDTGGMEWLDRKAAAFLAAQTTSPTK